MCLVTQSCPALCDLMDCILPGSSVPGILQARILVHVTMPSSSGSSQPRDQTQVSCIASRFFTVWVTMEAQFNLHFFDFEWCWTLCYKFKSHVYFFVHELPHSYMPFAHALIDFFSYWFIRILYIKKKLTLCLLY